MANPLSYLIPTTQPMTSDIIGKINTIIPVLKANHIANTITVTQAIANKYIGDLAGLFRNELSMQDDHTYANIRINGYYSSSCYSGERLTFSILDQSVLATYLKLFRK